MVDNPKGRNSTEGVTPRTAGTRTMTEKLKSVMEKNSEKSEETEGAART